MLSSTSAVVRLNPILDDKCLDSVEKADNIGVRRVKLMPWSKGLESKKEEVPDDVLVVMVQPRMIM